MKKSYYEYVLTIDGMMCGMCEAHVNNIVYKSFPNVKKVKSSARKNRTIIRSNEKLDLDALKEVIGKTGYIVKEAIQTK